MKMKGWAGLLALIMSTSVAMSQTTISMDHNGSLMSYYTDDHTGYVTITYVQPKPSLWDGVWVLAPCCLRDIGLIDGNWREPRMCSVVVRFRTM